MSKKTEQEHIQRRISASIDLEWFKRVRKEAKFLFGNQETIYEDGMLGQGGGWPDYPDMVPDYQEVGTSKLILSAGIINLSRLMKSFPTPVWSQVDKPTQIIRSQFWQARAAGVVSGEQAWLDIGAKAWLDGYYHGRGVVQLGFKKNPKTGEDYVCAQHIPLHRYVSDRSVRSAVEARYEAYKHMVPVEDAVAMFGSKVEKFKVPLRNSTIEDTGENVEVVPIIEYYDMGYGSGEPTRAFFAGSFTEDALEIEEWEHECLPSVVYEHMLLPQMRYPVGAISILVASQEAVNDSERAIRNEMQRVGFDIVSDAIDPKDLAKIDSGVAGVKARLTRPLNQGEKVYERVPGAEASQTTLKANQIAQQDFVRLSLVNELDQGRSVQGANTLGEVELVDQRSQGAMGWSVLQTLMFYKRWAEKFSMLAANDTDPIQVDIEWNGKKSNFTVNDPMNNGTWASEWFKEPSDIVLGESQLTLADTERQKTRKLTEVMSLADGVQAGIIDPNRWFEERLTILGYEPSEFMTKTDPASQMPGQPGQMGQPDLSGGMKMPGAPPVGQSAIMRQGA